MTYMNKLPILFLITLSSCQQLNWVEIPDTISAAINGVPDIQITKDFFDSSSFSFIKVSSGRYINFTATLSSIEDDIYKWVNAEGYSIYTKNGKVSKISASAKDSLYFLTPNFDFDYKTEKFFENSIMFQSPKALMQQNSKLNYLGSDVINYLDADIETSVYEETFDTEILEWSGTNKYWIKKDSDLVLRSEQFIYPLRKVYRIEYFYKFKD